MRISIIDSAECSCRTILPAAASRRSCVRVARQCAPVSSTYIPILHLSLSPYIFRLEGSARARACAPPCQCVRAAGRGSSSGREGAGVGVRGAIESLRHRCPRRMDVSCQRETCDRARPLSGDLGRPSATSAECLSRVRQNRVAHTCDTGERVTRRIVSYVLSVYCSASSAREGKREGESTTREDRAIKTIRIDYPLCDPSIRSFVCTSPRRDMQCRNSRLS